MWQTIVTFWRHLMCKHPKHAEHVAIDNEGKRAYRCGDCGTPTHVYDTWWQKLWVTVERTDLMDERFRVPWYMGHVAELADWHFNRATFTVIPLSTVLDLIIKAWRWAKYRKPSRWCHELEMTHRKAKVDLARETQARIYQSFKDELTSRDNEIRRLETELFRHLNKEVMPSGVPL